MTAIIDDLEVEVPTAARVVVDVDGRTAWWDGAGFGGDPHVVASAAEAVTIGLVVPVVGMFDAQSTATDALGAVAALCSSRPGRTRVLYAPDEVIDWLDGADPHTSEV